MMQGMLEDDGVWTASTTTFSAASRMYCVLRGKETEAVRASRTKKE